MATATLEFDEEDAQYLTSGLEAEWRRMLLSHVEYMIEGNEADIQSLQEVKHSIYTLKARINNVANKAFNDSRPFIADGMEPDDIPF